MFRSVQRVFPNYLDPRKVYLWTEMIIKLRKAKVKTVLCFLTQLQKLSKPNSQLLFLTPSALPIFWSPTHTIHYLSLPSAAPDLIPTLLITYCPQ